MSSVESFVPSVLTITERAVEKVRDLKTEENNENIKLRVYVTGGGCSGFQYGFSFDEKKAAEDDTSIQIGDITVLVDALSIQYLAGSVVDYEIDLMGSRFTVANPNAVTTCGCGASFSI